MPWTYTLEVEMPDEFKAFGATLDETKLALEYRWIGFAEPHTICNDVLRRLKAANSFEDVNKIMEMDEVHKQLVETVNIMFNESYVKNAPTADEKEKFAMFKLMVDGMNSDSRFGDKLRQIVFNGEHHAKIKRVIAASFVDLSSVEVVDADSELVRLAPSSYEKTPKKSPS